MSKIDEKNIALGGRLRLAREQAGLSQGQVAKMLNLHRPSVTETEAGRRKATPQELAECARIYGVSVDWLVSTGTDESDARRDKVQLVARKLANLKQEDLDLVLQVLVSLKTEGDVEE
jgi:transcriptional regulator with XRE-family HTH domain